MEGGEAGRGSGGPGKNPRAPRPRGTAGGQVWIACVICRRPVELAESVETADGRVCRECAVGT